MEDPDLTPNKRKTEKRKKGKKIVERKLLNTFVIKKKT